MLILLNLLVVALAVSAASVTITKTKVTERFRAWLWKQSGFGTVAYLFDCPYCMSHWIAFVLVAETFGWQDVITYLTLCGAVIALAAIVTGLIMKLMGWDQVEIDSLRAQLDEAHGLLEKLST